MELTDDMEMIVAHAINNKGVLYLFETTNNKFDYLSEDAYFDILQKLECLGYIQSTQNFSIFTVRVKEIIINDKKTPIWDVPQDIIDMANSLEEMKNTEYIEEALLKKYNKADK